MDTTAATPNIIQHGEERAQFVQKQIFKTQAEIRQNLQETLRAGQSRSMGFRGHRPAPPTPGATGPPAVGAFLPCCSGFTRAISVPSRKPSIISWPSVRRTIFNSCARSEEPFLT